MTPPRRRLLVALAAAALLLAFASFLVTRSPDPESRRRASAPAEDAAPPVASAPPGASDETDALPAPPPGFEPGDPGVAWSRVDLDAVREALPDNRYWTEQMPTDDAAVLAERAEEAERVREMRTRVESGHASPDEIDAYYDRQRRVYGDGIEFSGHLIDHYGDVLDDRSLRLLAVANRLHRARLLDLPREQQLAHERHERLEQARADWQSQQSAFSKADDESARTPSN